MHVHRIRIRIQLIKQTIHWLFLIAADIDANRVLDKSAVHGGCQGLSIRGQCVQELFLSQRHNLLFSPVLFIFNRKFYDRSEFPSLPVSAYRGLFRLLTGGHHLAGIQRRAGRNRPLVIGVQAGRAWQFIGRIQRQPIDLAGGRVAVQLVVAADRRD